MQLGHTKLIRLTHTYDANKAEKMKVYLKGNEKKSFIILSYNDIENMKISKDQENGDQYYIAKQICEQPTLPFNIK